MSKMTDDDVAETLSQLTHGAPTNVRERLTGSLRAHIAAVTAERDTLNREMADECKAHMRAQEEARTLRERVKALEADLDDKRALAHKWQTSAKGLHGELAAIRQRAGDGLTLARLARAAVGVPAASFANSWREMTTLAQQQWSNTALAVARHVLGDDSSDGKATCPGCLGAAHTTPCEMGIDPLHCCGTTTDVHRENCPTAEALKPLCTAPPTELDGLRGEMAENPDASGEADQPFPERPLFAEPTAAEAFATVRQWAGHLPFDDGKDEVARALSLLERRMGAMTWAIRDALAAFEVDYPEDAVHKALPLLRAALTDAPPVFTLEEVENAAGILDLPTDDWNLFIEKLRALRR